MKRKLLLLRRYPLTTGYVYTWAADALDQLWAGGGGKRTFEKSMIFKM